MGNSDGASIDENVSIESESTTKKKKKKSKAGKDKPVLSVDTPTECTDIKEIDKASRKEKKKKRKDEKLENQLENIDSMPTVSDNLAAVDNKRNASGSNSVSNSNGEDAP